MPTGHGDHFTYQLKANAFLKDLIAMKKGKMDSAWYVECRSRYPSESCTPTLFWDGVPSTTCQQIIDLIRADEDPDATICDIVPETPHKEQITRHIDLEVKKGAYNTSKRILDAKDLEEVLKISLPPIYDFLRAARQRQDEIKFPSSELRLLEKLEVIRGSLDGVEAMLKSFPDPEATESDSDSQ
ncbi:hypothetical protein B0H17DRAFT_1147779 [Mycena rosella]|uniref:Uncharacterized protein n=1 Tax=Mycena rosella TaxID=1033263 RepID=A0AAD7CHG1_MYCRO|nr:hypothetical protein B0H17DRAFT_1147779 [Mycena rosella]